MERLKPTQIETMNLPEREIPLVGNLIQLMRYLGIPEIDIQFPFSNPAFQKIAESYLLSLAVREAGDSTGILGPLIGVSQSPEETREILTEIGEQLLQQLEQSGLKNQVLAVLQGKKTDNIEVFLKIDKLVGQTVGAIRQVAVDRGIANPKLKNMTLDAFDFWLKNRLALKKLERQTKKNPVELLGFQLIYETDARGTRMLSKVNQKPIIPVIDNTPLQAILPPEINRLENREQPEINTHLGFLARLNMGGNPVFRLLTQTAHNHLQRQQLVEKVSLLS